MGRGKAGDVHIDFKGLCYAHEHWDPDELDDAPSGFPVPDRYFRAAQPGKTSIFSTPGVAGPRLLLILSPAHSFHVCLLSVPDASARGSFWTTYVLRRLDAVDARFFQERISLLIVVS